MIQWNEHLINGARQAVRSGRTVRIHDAATEAPLGDIHLGHAGDVDQAVEAARLALPGWQRLGLVRGRPCCVRWRTRWKAWGRTWRTISRAKSACR